MMQLSGHLYAPEDRGRCLVTVAEGRIAAIRPLEASQAVPAGALGGPGARLLPGLLDLQLNGAFGHDFADPQADLAAICAGLPRFGVTGFVPRNLVERAGLEPSLAVRLATLNPARLLGLDGELGRVALGRRADLVVLDERWEVLATLVDGEVAYAAGRTGAVPGGSEAGAGVIGAADTLRTASSRQCR